MRQRESDSSIPDFSWHQIALLLILSVGVASRVYNLDHLGLWSDEMWGVLACSLGSLSAMIDNLIHADSHPPGYETMLYYWMQLFGQSDFVIRLPSALAGIGLILAVYKTSKDHFSICAALLASTLISVSYMAVYYSQEARAYSILMLVATIHINFLLRIVVDEQEDWWNRSGFILTAAAMMYLHYLGTVVMASEGLIFAAQLAMKPSKKMFYSGLIVFGLSLLLYAPWLPFMYHHATSIQNYWAQKPEWADMNGVWLFLTGRSKEITYTLYAVFGAQMGLLIIKLFKKKLSLVEQKIGMLYSLIVVSFVTYFAKSVFTQSIFTERHFLYALPIVCILAGNIVSLAVVMISSGSKKIEMMIASTIIVALLIGGVRFNIKGHLYDKNDHNEFRGAVEFVMRDKPFMQGKHYIITRGYAFNHYIKQLGVLDAPLFTYENKTMTGDVIPGIRKTVAGGEFYFLEVALTGADDETSEVQQSLDENFTRLCRTNLTAVRVMKYRALPNPGHIDSNQPCSLSF